MDSIESVLPSNAEITWNDDLKQNVANYSKNGSNYTMWIEDAKSIEAKLDLCLEKELAGVAFWEKDRETDDIWSLVERKLF